MQSHFTETDIRSKITKCYFYQTLSIHFVVQNKHFRVGHQAVLTIIYGILFARFRTAEHISKNQLSIYASSFEKCMCWRQRHNVLERKWSKSGVFSFISFFKCYDVTKKAWYSQNMVDYMKTSIKNTIYYSRDYLNHDAPIYDKVMSGWIKFCTLQSHVWLN